MNLFSRYNFSLLNKIMIAFISYTGLMLLILSVLVIVVEKNHINHLSTTNSKQLLLSENQMIGQFLGERTKDVMHIANLWSRFPDDTYVYQSMVSLANDAEDTYGRFFYYGTDGTYMDTLGLALDKDKLSAYLTLVTEGNETVISPVVVDATLKQPTFDILVPVQSGGITHGLVGATLLVKNLSNLVLTEDELKGGYLWLVSEEGKILYHPSERKNLQSIKEDDFAKIVESAQEGRLIKLSLDPRENTFVTGMFVDGTNWLLLFTIYESTLNDSIRSMIFSLLIIGLILIGTTSVLSYFFARDITKPILNLIEVTKRFSTGVKGIRAKVDSKDEIGALATSFNAMADTIVAHTDNLEELIKERTQVLADLNYQIVSRNKELGTMNEELEKTNNKLHELATTDMLTGLYNRHHFVRELQKTMDLVNAGQEENFALVFVDLDNFKYYNDTFSHEIGDYILQRVSEILKEATRENDMVGRFGGDEFVLLLRQGDYEAAKMIAQRMHKGILDKDGFKEELSKKLRGEVKIMGKNKLSSSIGIINYMRSMNIRSAEELMTKADETMYRAKKEGKSRIVVG